MTLMPNIKLTDSSSLFVDASIADRSVLGGTADSTMHFLRSDVIGAMNQPLDRVQIKSSSIGFNYAPSFPISGGTATLIAGGGLTGELDLCKPTAAATSNPLFPKDQYGTEVEMGRNYYLALSFQLSPQAGGTATLGAFTLKLTGRETSCAKLYMPFSPDAAGNYPTLKDALQTLFATFALPSSVADMTALPRGTVFTYDAQGCVSFNATLDVLAAVNPTASLGVCTSYGPITVEAGPSITIGGGFSLSGELQVRIWNKDGNVIQLGYYKKRGANLCVTFDESVGADVTAGSYDILARLYGLLGDAGKLDPAWLKNNVPSAVADDVESAYESAVQTKLSIAFDEECDSAITDEVAFSWSFDTRTTGVEAQQAFGNAVRGDLSMLFGGSLPAGVTKVGSVFDRLKETKHTFKFNFLGLFDYARVEDASLKMSVKVSDDGQVVITDTATLDRLNATATPWVKSDLLRKVLAEDFVATVGYGASLGNFAPQLKLSYSYYDYVKNGHTSDLRMFVDVAKALSVTDNAENDWNLVLASGLSSQSASLLASLDYDNVAAGLLLLDGDSRPRSIEYYEKAGRTALARTPGLDLNPTFVAYLQDDKRWQQLVDAGAKSNVVAVLGADPMSPPPWATVSYDWTQHILSWAPAMHSAAQSLQNVLQYVAHNPALNPRTDNGFLQRRQILASQIKTAVQKTPLFDDAQALMTIFQTGRPTGKSVVIRYAGKTKTYTVRGTDSLGASTAS
jgi:hypothetical protein